jgi:hypothetical protein
MISRGVEIVLSLFQGNRKGTSNINWNHWFTSNNKFQKTAERESLYSVMQLQLHHYFYAIGDIWKIHENLVLKVEPLENEILQKLDIPYISSCQHVTLHILNNLLHIYTFRSNSAVGDDSCVLCIK